MEPQDPNANPGGQEQNPQQQNSGVFSQPFRNNPVAARVPERVARGVFSTGVIIQDGPNEFVLDFLQALSRPPQISARVVITHNVFASLVNTLNDNLNRYIQTFGPPPPLPRPQVERKPSIQEIYENFKLPEELYSGAYANSVLIGHSPAEFFLDFITGFYPHASVSCRIYLSAPQVPRVLETLRTSWQQYQKRLASAQQQQQQQNPPPPPNPEG